MTQAYLYRWTELSTGKTYIGSRYAKNCHPNDGYICSSKVVKPLIEQNPTNWQKQILVVGNPTDIRELESKYLTVLDAAKNSHFYNKRNGSGSFHTVGIPISEKRIKFLKENNPSFRDDVKEKLRAKGKSRDVSHLQSQECVSKKSIGQKRAWAEGKFVGVGFKSGEQNIAKTPEVRAKISTALKNFKGGRMTGKKHSEETKKKMAATRVLYWSSKRFDANQNFSV